MIQKKPSYLFLELTNACNADCPACDFRRSNMGFTRRLMSKHHLNLLINEIKNLDLDLYLQSGEPLIHPDLTWLVDSIHQLQGNAGVHLTSNGQLLKKRPQPWHLFKSITFSIDGRYHLADRIRHLKNQEEKITNTINTILQARSNKPTPKVSISFVIRPENQNLIYDFCKYWTTYNIDSIEIIQLQGTTSQAVDATLKNYPFLKVVPRHLSEDNWIGINPIILESQFSKIRSLKDKRIIIWPDTKGDEIRKFYSSSTKFIGNTLTTTCNKPWQSLEVSVDGSIKLSGVCIDMKLGHLEDGGILEAWNHPTLNNFREIIKRDKSIPACARCCGNFGDGFFSLDSN